MNFTMRKRVVLAFSLALLLLGPSVAQAGTSGWSTLSTLLAAGLPAAAGLESLNQGDTTGLRELIVGEGATVLSVEALKHVVHERRPDGSGIDSFPSGHTAAAFAAARYMDKRYGGSQDWLWYSLAGLTGVARVEARRHHWYDVVAGGTVGFIAADLSTSSRHSALVITPTAGGLDMQWIRNW